MEKLIQALLTLYPHLTREEVIRYLAGKPVHERRALAMNPRVRPLVGANPNCRAPTL